MTITCPNCGADNADDARFCNQCGNDLAAKVTDAERRQITVFFADLSGYTAMSDTLDPEDVQEIMSTVFTHATRIVEKYGGRIDKFQGDAVMAVFGDPVAHEDDAERAVRSVLELHAAVDAYSPEVEERIGRPIQMHTGINSGLIVTGGVEFDNAVGDAINVASRLEDLSESGEVLIGAETAQLVDGVFEVADHGTHHLKGKSGPVTVTKVLGLASARKDPSRRSGRFVGRHEELGILLGAVERMRDGESTVVTIEAEAGAGKTRLLAEFKRRLPDEVQWLEGRAYAYGENIPYSPIIDLLSRSVGIQEDDSPQVIEKKLRTAVSDLVDEVDATYEPLSRLYGLTSSQAGSLDRETYQRRLLESVVRMAEALAGRAPTVLAFQDLHWSDASTVKLIRDLIEHLVTPVVMVANYRPGFNLDIEGERELTLSALSPRQTDDLLKSLLDDSEPPQHLTEFIVRRTEGNPFFIEEIVNSLVETESLVRVDGPWRLEGDLDDIDLPSTIRGVIGARIDRLDEKRRRVLREASVVGREFLYDVVRRVTSVRDDLDPSLSDLETADLIREKSVDPDLEYLFKHALTQDVAYDGLLKSEREELHARAATAIETQFEGRLDEVTETLAYHWSHSADSEKAVEYLRAAGFKAMDRFALREGRAHYEAAYDILVEEEHTPTRDKAIVELLLEWALLAYYEARLHFLRDRLLENQELVDRVGTDHERAMWIAWLGHAYMAADAEMVKAVKTLDVGLELARRASDIRAIGYIQSWRCYALAWSYGLDAAIEAGNEAYRIGKETLDDPYIWMKAALGVGLFYALSGQWERSRELADELVAYGDVSGSSRAAAMGWITHLNGNFSMDPERERYFFDRMMEVAPDPIYEHAAMPPRLLSLIEAGRVEEARQFWLDHRHRFYEDAHVHMLNGWFQLGDGLLQVMEGDPSGGLDQLEEVAEEAEGKGEWIFAHWSQLIQARVYGNLALTEAGVGEMIRHAPLLMKRGRKIRRADEGLRRMLENLAGWRLEGLAPHMRLGYAVLLHHRGDREGAIDNLGKAIGLVESRGETAFMRQCRGLLDEWSS